LSHSIYGGKIIMKNWLERFAQPQTPLAWLAVLRILLGVMFLTTWASNLFKGFYTPDGLLLFFTDIFPQAENPLAWYAAFIDNVILPARGAFAPFQLVTEFLLGLFLLLGVFTPWSAAAAAFFILNTFLATLGHDWPWSYVMILGMLFVIFWARAGRSLGIDGRLARKRPKAPLPYLW
jgi:uncharacterized membrane protein YphA (DoxX/SURF4 family)